ncbi:ABC transporter permease [Bacillus carboniphilus]|uniref:ABC transporter permease n=1 Tax=Bacillus carboniphilus TaxID=86663 RepID=A0ABY9JTW9_9BACI|nr:oligopeptide ABC transporter permease [Bacillus carboniphilus]WLR41867.1 ABC transporter permease [Bacillus carboniphilus]
MAEPVIREPNLNPDKVEFKKKTSKSPLQLALQRFLKNKMAIAGIVILFIVSFLAIFAPLLSSQDPYATDLYNTEAEPSSEHWLGTDDSGRDIYTRLLYGGRVSLLIGLITMIGTVVIGATLGAVAGYFGRWIDNIIMRISDVIIALPFLLMILFVVTVLEKSNMWILIGILIVVVWPVTTRIVRAEFLSLREREFVLSAQAAGCKSSRIIFRHIIPNAIAPLIVNATLLMGTMITIESSLSFLGFGVPEPTPTWGNMLNSARSISTLTTEPWRWIPPGFLIVITVLAINFIGDGLRDAFDGKSTRR